MTGTRTLPRSAPTDGSKLDQVCFESALFTRDAAFEAKSPAERKGRLARLTYEVESIDIAGLNRRIYPSEVAGPAIEVLNEKCKRGEVYGREDHPYDFDENAYRVTVADACVVVESVVRKGDKAVEVTMAVCDNEYGQHLMSIFNAGGTPKISQRGVALWEEITDAEREKYGVPEEAYCEIARFLRLITYDVVAQPGFTQDEPIASESADPGTGTMKTFDELLALHPGIAAEGISRGKAQVDIAKIATEAVEAAKPAIIEAAIKPLNEKIAALTTANEAQKASLEGIKPLLIKAGVAVEQVSDSAMLQRLDTANSARLTAEAKLVEAEGKLKLATEQVESQKKIAGAAAATKAVQEKYGKFKIWPLVQEAVAGICDEKLALEAAAKEVGKIQKLATVMGNADPTTVEAGTKNGNEADGGANNGGAGGGNPGFGIGNAIMSAGHVGR